MMAAFRVQEGEIFSRLYTVMRLELATHQKNQISMSVAIWDAEKAVSGRTFPYYVHSLFHFCFTFSIYSC